MGIAHSLLCLRQEMYNSYVRYRDSHDLFKNKTGATHIIRTIFKKNFTTFAKPVIYQFQRNETILQRKGTGIGLQEMNFT